MAKVKPEVWDKARALREAGKSYREIGNLLNIPHMTVSDRAKREDWSAGKTGQLIKDSVRVEAEIRTLSPVQEKIVRTEVNKQLEGMMFYSTNARKAVKIGLVALSKNPSESGMKTVLDGMKSGMQVEGLVPFYPGPLVNNTNAQQTIIEKPKSLSDFYGDSKP